MYGMSAKDRMSLFEKKGNSDTKKASGAPKKIGKLNIGVKKEPEKQALRKPLAKKLDTKKDKESKNDTGSKSQEKKVEEKKEEETKVEEKKLEEKKAEEKKLEEKKAAEKKLEEKKAEEKKLAEKKAEEKKLAEKKAEEKKLAEKKAEEKKLDEKKAEEKKIAEKKAEEKKLAEKKAEEKKLAEKKAEEKKLEEKKAEEKKLAEKKAAEKKLEEQKAEEKKLAEKKAEEKKLAEKKAEEKKLAEKKAEEKKLEEKKAAEKKEEEKMKAAKKEQAAKTKEEPSKTTEVKTLTPHAAVTVDDLDLDSVLEANLGVMSDVELQSPTSIPVSPMLETAKAQPATKEQKPAEDKKPKEPAPAKQPAPTAKPAEPEKAKFVVQNIPPTDLELKAKASTAATNAVKVEAIPKTNLTLTAKPQAAKEPAPKAEPAAAKVPAAQPVPAKAETAAAAKPASTKQEATAEKKPEPPKPKEEPAKVGQQAQPKAPVPKQQPAEKATVAEKPADTKKQAAQQNVEDQEVSAIMDGTVKEEKPEPKKEQPVAPKKEAMPKHEFKPIPEEFYNTIFYFSGMGTVVGSALAEGVYVAENTARISLDDDVVQSAKKDLLKVEADKDAVIRTARGQATDISMELKHLQNLLDSLPTFLDTDINAQQVTRATDKAIRGSHFAPQKPETPAWVKRQPVPQPQQNAIPTWKQQVQDGMAMMGQQPGQRVHPGVQSQPFVPSQLRDKPAAVVAAKKPEALPQPKVEDLKSTDNRLQPIAPAAQKVVPPQVKDPGILSPGQKVEDKVQPISSSQAFVPPPPPPPPPPAPLPNKPTFSPSTPATAPAAFSAGKPAGGVQVFPVAPPKLPSGGQMDTHKPEVHRPEPTEARPPAEFLVKIAGKDQQPPPTHGRTREFGVHPADVNLPSQPWQERYGNKKVEELPQPKPFGHTFDPKGLKTWQLSRLRTLEAQGIDVRHPEEYELYSHMKATQSEESLPSLAPFLVSGRSKEKDFRQLAGETNDASYARSYDRPAGPKHYVPVNSTPFQPKGAPNFKPKSKSISAPTYRPVSAPFSVPRGYQANVNGTLPYCDL